MSKNGGPAFPRAEGETTTENDGMTLRDWFAGQALAGICSERSSTVTAETAAFGAYEYADAMLAERAK